MRGAPTQDAERCNDIMHALARLRELLLSKAGTGLDATLFWEMARELATSHDVPLIRGAATGLLYSAGEIDAATLTQKLQGHFIGASDPKESVAFLRGLLHSARDAAWQLPELLRALDELLEGWPGEQFVALLPELRLAFAAMTPKETDRIAEAVAQLHGAESLGPLVNYDVGEQQLAANLALSRTLQEVLDADGLGGWGRA
jgi:hypothetical protein